MPPVSLMFLSMRLPPVYLGLFGLWNVVYLVILSVCLNQTNHLFLTHLLNDFINDLCVYVCDCQFWFVWQRNRNPMKVDTKYLSLSLLFLDVIHRFKRVSGKYRQMQMCIRDSCRNEYKIYCTKWVLFTADDAVTIVTTAFACTCLLYTSRCV